MGMHPVQKLRSCLVATSRYAGWELGVRKQTYSKKGVWDIESILKVVEVSAQNLVRSIPLAGREMLWTEISAGKSIKILGSLYSKMNGHTRVQRKEG